MIDLQPVPVPELSEEWITSHRAALVDAIDGRRRTPAAWAALAGATGAAASLTALIVVGGSAPSAFAGWSASPTPPTSGQLSAVDATCQARLAQAAQLAPSDKTPHLRAPFIPELSDVRGPYTVTLFGDGVGAGALCISTPGATSLRAIASSATGAGAGAIAVDQVSVLAREGQPYTLVEGRTGDRVTAVTLALGDGSTVTATSGDGLFVAWWPGSQTIVSAAVSTATGVSTQTLNLPGPNLPLKSPPPNDTPST
jgi:hypothetical protein